MIQAEPFYVEETKDLVDVGFAFTGKMNCALIPKTLLSLKFEKIKTLKNIQLVPQVLKPQFLLQSSCLNFLKCFRGAFEAILLEIVCTL